MTRTNHSRALSLTIGQPDIFGDLIGFRGGKRSDAISAKS
jgi:hypothetical protein